jgi:hypothetical protein
MIPKKTVLSIEKYNDMAIKYRLVNMNVMLIKFGKFPNERA